MSKTGSKSIDVTSHDVLKFTWTETSTDVTANTSTISWKLELISDSSGRISSTSDKSWKVIFNGVTYSGTNTIGINANTTKTLASKSGIKISHSSDGSLSVSYSFSQEVGINFGGSYIGTKSGSGTATLTTLARGSSITIPSGGVLGNSQTIKVTKNNSSYYHIIKAEGVKGGSQTVCTRTQSTSITWTPNISRFATYEPNSKTVSINITIETYANSTTSTKISSSTSTSKYTIPATSCSPIISSFSYSDVDNYSKYDTTLSSSDVWMIKTLSKLKYTAQAKGKYGSTIKTMSLKCNSTTHNATLKSSTVNGEVVYTGNYSDSNTWSYAGGQNATLTITDSRGYSTSKIYTIKGADYSPPTITKFNAHRTDSNISVNTGKNFKIVSSNDVLENILGSNAYVTLSCNVFTAINSYSNNIFSITLTYKGNATNSPSVSSGMDITKTSYGSSMEDAYLYIPINDDSDAYAIKITVTDIFRKSVSATTSVSSAFCLVHFNDNGKSMALGKLCSPNEEAGTLEIGYSNVVANGSDWSNLTIANGFRVYSNNSDNDPKIKRFGALVEIRGILEPTSNSSTGSDGKIIASGIPENMRPDIVRYYVCQGSGTNRWLLSVNPNGELKLHKYGITSYENINSYTSTDNGSWLAFSVMYMI